MIPFDLNFPKNIKSVLILLLLVYPLFFANLVKGTSIPESTNIDYSYECNPMMKLSIQDTIPDGSNPKYPTRDASPRVEIPYFHIVATKSDVDRRGEVTKEEFCEKMTLDFDSPIKELTLVYVTFGPNIRCIPDEWRRWYKANARSFKSEFCQTDPCEDGKQLEIKE